MVLLIAGIVIFVGVHLVPTLPALRSQWVGRFGEGGYKLAFALASLVGLAMIVIGYWPARINAWQIWEPPYALRHVTFLLMVPAAVLLAAAYIPSRIRDWARHPMLLAIKIWALAHLLVNGDAASALLFGSLLAYAVVDRISVKRRGALGPLAGATGTWRGDALAVAVGAGFYLFMMLWGHAHLIGMPLLRS